MFRVGNHEIRKELIWYKEEEKKKKNPSESGVLPDKQNENIQGKEMYGIGHSVSKMMDHCPKLENEEKERKEALRSGESKWDPGLEDLKRSKNGSNGRNCRSKKQARKRSCLCSKNKVSKFILWS